MFRGEFHNHVDEKGRFNIPARFRELIREQHEEPLILTVGLDQSLFLYPMDVWRKIEEKLSGLDTLNSEVRLFVRTILKATEECEIDKQGRVIISPVLRKESGIKKNIVIVGMLNRIEIWDQERYSTYHSQGIEKLETLAQKLSERGVIQGLML
jgi:MraZ protein